MDINIVNYKKLGLTTQELDMGSYEVREYINKALDKPIDDKLILCLSNSDNLIFVDKESINKLFKEKLANIEKGIDWADWYDLYAEVFAIQLFETLGYGNDDSRYFDSIIDYLWELYDEV